MDPGVDRRHELTRLGWRTGWAVAAAVPAAFLVVFFAWPAAALVARDPRTAAHCRLLGDRHLAVPDEHDITFRDALVDLGYALPLATH